MNCSVTEKTCSRFSSFSLRCPFSHRWLFFLVVETVTSSINCRPWYRVQPPTPFLLFKHHNYTRYKNRLQNKVVLNSLFKHFNHTLFHIKFQHHMAPNAARWSKCVCERYLAPPQTWHFDKQEPCLPSCWHWKRNGRRGAQRWLASVQVEALSDEEWSRFSFSPVFVSAEEVHANATDGSGVRRGEVGFLCPFFSRRETLCRVEAAPISLWDKALRSALC